MASRMLWSKGVADFVAAARLIRPRHPQASFVLFGGSAEDYGSKNPDFIPRAWLERLNHEGVVEWRGLSDPAVVEGVAKEIGLPGDTLVAKAQMPEVKQQLRAQTDEAIARGVFGVPSMEVGDELFWGYDDFPHLELFLAGKDPVDAAEWRSRDRARCWGLRSGIPSRPGRSTAGRPTAPR